MIGLKLKRHNSCFYGTFEGGLGGICYLDVNEPIHENLNKFDVYPFLIKYKIYSENKLLAVKTQRDFKFSKKETLSGKQVFTYFSEDGRLEARVYFTEVEGCGACTSYCHIVSHTDEVVVVEQLTSAFVSGIAGFDPESESDEIVVYTVENVWSGEGRVRVRTIDDLNLRKIYNHPSREEFSIYGKGSHTTEKFFPVVFVENKAKKTVWFFQLEPAGGWEISLSLKDLESCSRAFLSIKTRSGESAKHGWTAILNKGMSYTTPVTVFGAVGGTLNDSLAELTKYRRKNLVRKDMDRPLVFNDYMNCHWANQSKEKTFALIDAAAAAGAEVYCLDSGWYKNPGDDWFGVLGDWKPSEKIFLPTDINGIFARIQSLGMLPGLWLEPECCTLNADAAKNPDDWFVLRNGNRVFESGRYFFDFTNPAVTDYLRACFKKLYDIGARYFKIDYNASIGSSCDFNGVNSAYGLEIQFHAIKAFYRSLYEKFDGIILENCGSGAMREDYFILSEFDLQSISDCENYRDYPPILTGTFLNILPEHCGIWCMPYPQKYDQKDNENFVTEEYKKSRSCGEETIFNVTTAMMGTMYLSGRIDKADEYNLQLIKEGSSLFKQYRPFVKKACPCLLSDPSVITSKDVSALGLKNGNTILTGVFRRGGESSILISLKGIKNVRQIYPVNEKNGVSFKYNKDSLIVNFTKDYQARLFEIEVAD